MNARMVWVLTTYGLPALVLLAVLILLADCSG